MRLLDILVHPIKVYKEQQLFKSYGEIGLNSHVYSPYIISHPQNVFIGKKTTILDSAEICLCPEKTGYRNIVQIGDNCYIREFVTLLGAGGSNMGMVAYLPKMCR